MFENLGGMSGQISPQMLQQLLMLQQRGMGNSGGMVSGPPMSPAMSPMSSFATPSIPFGAGSFMPNLGAGLLPLKPTPQSSLPASNPAPSPFSGSGSPNAAGGGAGGAAVAPPGVTSLPGAGPGQTMLQALAGMDPQKMRQMLATFGIAKGGGAGNAVNAGGGPLGAFLANLWGGSRTNFDPGPQGGWQGVT